MSGVYVDTSPLAKWYLNEPGSDAFAAFIMRRAPATISRLTVVELRCLLARRRAGEMPHLLAGSSAVEVTGAAATAHRCAALARGGRQPHRRDGRRPPPVRIQAMTTTDPDLATATAHRAWDARWRTEAGREGWLEPDPDVVAALPLLRERGARRVLDLGCGVGRHARVLAAGGFETSALDGSEGGIARLREAAAADGLAIDLSVGLMTDLPYGDGAFDYVLAFNVIYHGDPAVVARAVAEIRRVLRPGGLYQGTMLSKRHERYGRGTRIAPDTFVLDEDDDTAHPHFYCDAAGVIGLFRGFEPLSLVDRPHRKPGSWHWHMLAERLAGA